MTNHKGPESIAPDDQRCEALVKGHLNYNFQWMRFDHRCPKRANQMREGIAVCHLHAKAKFILPYSGG